MGPIASMSVSLLLMRRCWNSFLFLDKCEREIWVDVAKGQRGRHSSVVTIVVNSRIIDNLHENISKISDIQHVVFKVIRVD